MNRLKVWAFVTGVMVGITLLLFLLGNEMAWWSLSATLFVDGAACILVSRSLPEPPKDGVMILGVLMILASILHPFLELAKAYNF